MRKQAVINVSDPENITTLAQFLTDNGWEIFATRKNASLLSSNGIAVTVEEGLNKKGNIADYMSLMESVMTTGFHSEIENMDKIRQVQLVCINLKPDFKQLKDLREVASYLSDTEDRSVTFIQMAAKNCRNVILLTDINDYNETIVRLRTDSFTDEYRMMLAAKALNMVAAYNGAAANSILHQVGNNDFPNFLPLPYQKVATLSAGMNAHQRAVFYSISNEIGAASGFKKMHWKNVTFETVSNIAVAWKFVYRFARFLKNPYAVDSTTFEGASYTTQFTPAAGSVFTVAVVCNAIVGAALGSSASESCKKTFSRKNIDCRKTTLGCSSVVDKDTANIILQANVATVIAPSYTPEAREILETNPNIHICNSSHELLYDFNLVSIDGGLLVQSEDDMLFKSWKIVTHIRPTQEQADAMSFGMLVAMSSKCEIAILIRNMTVIDMRCNELVALDFKNIPNEEDTTDKKIIMVCNTALPFTESVQASVVKNVAAIIQTGGTDNDDAFIDFCNAHNIAMVFTGITHISI